MQRNLQKMTKKEKKGLNKDVIKPSPEELKRYSESVEPKETALDSKATLCAEIIKLQHPKCSQRELVALASNLMNKSTNQLLLMRTKIKQRKGL